MRVARLVILNEDEREALAQVARRRLAPAFLVERARIVLFAAAGLQDRQIASKLGITSEKVARWRKRYLDGGLPAIEKDAPRAGKRRALTDAKVAEVIRKTVQEKPPGAACWTTRAMAAAVGLSEASIRRIWRANSLKPHRQR